MRSAWHHDPRIRLSEQKTAKLFLERHGCCRECGRKLGPSDRWIVEHIIALENGGSNNWDNLGITCLWCKPLKDAADHARAAKQRNTATKYLLPRALRKKSALAKKQGTKYDWRQRRYVKIDPRSDDDSAVPDVSRFEALRACWLSGQMSEADMHQHMASDAEFAAWMRRTIDERDSR